MGSAQYGLTESESGNNYDQVNSTPILSLIVDAHWFPFAFIFQTLLLVLDVS